MDAGGTGDQKIMSTYPKSGRSWPFAKRLDCTIATNARGTVGPNQPSDKSEENGEQGSHPSDPLAAERLRRVEPAGPTCSTYFWSRIRAEGCILR